MPPPPPSSPTSLTGATQPPHVTSAMARREWLTRSLALSSSLLLPGLSACDSPPESSDTLTIAHGYHASLGLLYIADQVGIFKTEGLEVQFKRYSYGRDTINATLDGKADIATPFDTPAALSILREEPVRVLSSLCVISGNAQVLGNKRRGIHAPADLMGRRIGFVPNSIGEYVLSMVLANAGINEKRVVLLPTKTPEELSQAMVDGDLDAAALWPPFTNKIAEKLGGDSVVKFTNSAYLETGLVTTTETTLKNNRRAIKKMMQALTKAEDFALRNPERALHHIKNALPDTPPDVVAATWSSTQPQVRVDNRLLKSLEQQIIWLHAKMHLEKAYPSDVYPYIADEILRSIRPQAVTLNQQR